MAIINPQTGQAFEENKNPFNNEVVDPTFAKVTQEDYAGGVKANAELPPVPPTPPPVNTDGTKNPATGYSLIKPPGYTAQQYADKYAPGGMHWEYDSKGNRIAVNNTDGVDYSQYDSTYNRTDTPDPTVKDVYGSDYSGAEKTYLDILNEQTKPVNEADIRRQKMELFQGEIDALNKLYATKKADEQIAGQGRLGSSTAIQSRRGLLGSDFGAAQTEGVSTYNRQVQSAIDAEKGAKIGAILSKVREESVREFEAKTAARKQGAQNYINYLSGAEERKTKKVSEAVSDALYNGVGDNEFFNELANSLGVPVSKVKAEYNRQKAAKDKADEKDVMTVAPGASIYDKSGKFIGTAPEKPTDNKPITQEVGDTLLQWDAATNSWKSIYTAPKDASNQKIVNINGKDYVLNADGTYSEPVVPNWNSTVDQESKNWASLISEGKAKLTDVPSEKRSDVAVALNALPPKQSEIDNIQKKITSLGGLVDSDEFSTGVGVRGLARVNFNPFSLDDKAQRLKLISTIDQLVGSSALKALVEAKNSGATFGALSDAELNLLKNSASQFDSWARDKDGDGKTDYYEIDEGTFVSEVKKIQKEYQDLADKMEKEKQEKSVGEDFNFLFSNPLSMGQNGSNTSQAPQAPQVSDVSGIKDFSRVNTLMGAGVATGITNGSGAWKYGLDLVLDGGQKAPVKTPFGGEVILANADGGFGNSVKVRLDNGEVIRLSHLKSMNVKKGQRIPAGSIIGIQGNTGTTIKVGKGGTGTHVDVTIYDKSGKPYSSQQVASRINTKLS